MITDHNFRETLAICDRVYVLKDGALLASGTPAQIVDNPLVRTYYLGERFWSMKLRTGQSAKTKLSSTLKSWLPLLQCPLSQLHNELTTLVEHNPFCRLEMSNEAV